MVEKKVKKLEQRTLDLNGVDTPKDLDVDVRKSNKYRRLKLDPVELTVMKIAVSNLFPLENYGTGINSVLSVAAERLKKAMDGDFFIVLYSKRTRREKREELKNAMDR